VSSNDEVSCQALQESRHDVGLLAADRDGANVKWCGRHEQWRHAMFCKLIPTESASHSQAVYLLF